MEEYSALDDATVDALLRDAEPGQYVVYTADQVGETVPTDAFECVCISFKTEGGADAEHNLVFRCRAQTGAWAEYSGWVTIHPAPWEDEDVASAVQSGMLFRTLGEMCELLPALTERLDPCSGKVLTIAPPQVFRQTPRSMSFPEYFLPADHTFEEAMATESGMGEEQPPVLLEEALVLFGSEQAEPLPAATEAVMPAAAAATTIPAPRPVAEAGVQASSLVERRTGVGISLGLGNDGFCVEGVASNSPASLAGIEKGDIVEMIDGTTMDGSVGLKHAVRLLRGPVGSIAILQICRKLGRRESETDPAMMRGSIAITRRPVSNEATKQVTKPALSLEDLQNIFATLDKNHDGQISHIEFIRGLKQNPWIADKLDMPDHIQQEDGTRDRYQLSFGEIDADDSKTISLSELCRFYGYKDLDVSRIRPSTSSSSFDPPPPSPPPAIVPVNAIALQQQAPSPSGEIVSVRSSQFSKSQSASSKCIIPNALVLRQDARQKASQVQRQLEEQLRASREKLKQQRESIAAKTVSRSDPTVDVTLSTRPDVPPGATQSAPKSGDNSVALFSRQLPRTPSVTSVWYERNLRNKLMSGALLYFL